MSHDNSLRSFRAAKRKKSRTVSLLTTDANVCSFVASVILPRATNRAFLERSILMSKTKYVSTNSYPGGTFALSSSIKSNAGKTFRISFSIAFRQKSVPVFLLIAIAWATLFGSSNPYLWVTDQYFVLTFFLRIRSRFLSTNGTHHRKAGSLISCLSRRIPQLGPYKRLSGLPKVPKYLSRPSIRLTGASLLSSFSVSGQSWLSSMHLPLGLHCLSFHGRRFPASLATVDLRRLFASIYTRQLG